MESNITEQINILHLEKKKWFSSNSDEKKMAFLVRIIFCDTESLRKLYWSFQLQVFFSHIFFLEVSKGIREAKQKDWKGTGIKEKKHKPESVSWSTPQMASLDHRCKGPRTTNQEPQRSIQAGMQLCPLFSFSPTKWENEKKNKCTNEFVNELSFTTACCLCDETWSSFCDLIDDRRGGSSTGAAGSWAPY